MTAVDPRVGEIENRLNAATPGPWANYGNLGHEVYAINAHENEEPGYVAAAIPRQRDAEFIAHSPSDVAYLLAELRKRDEALDRVGTVAGSLEARAFMNDRNTAAGLYDEAMELAADAASSIAREAAAQLRAAVTVDGA